MFSQGLKGRSGFTGLTGLGGLTGWGDWSDLLGLGGFVLTRNPRHPSLDHATSAAGKNPVFLARPFLSSVRG